MWKTVYIQSITTQVKGENFNVAIKKKKKVVFFFSKIRTVHIFP